MYGSPRPRSSTAMPNPTWIKHFEQWEKAAYDGIKGFPPKWIQRPFLNSFFTARGILFDFVETRKATYKEYESASIYWRTTSMQR
jgi:hypothetical protein